jgi:hypothetical protein
MSASSHIFQDELQATLFLQKLSFPIASISFKKQRKMRRQRKSLACSTRNQFASYKLAASLAALEPRAARCSRNDCSLYCGRKENESYQTIDT